MILKPIIMFIIAYLLGGINFSILMSKIVHKKDVRDLGSGNAGMTNVLRNFGKLSATIVFLGDIIKTIVAILIAWYMLPSEFSPYVAGLGVVLGHNFPLFYNFKGGKGILTTSTIAVFLSPIAGIIMSIVAIAIIFATGYVSLGSIILCALFPILVFILNPTDIHFIIFSFIIGMLGIYMHRSNIKKLLSGTENRFRRKDNV